MTLQNVIQIDQEHVKEIYRFAVLNGHNVLCIGPSGAGKTMMAFQVCDEEKITPIYWNLSVSERVDVQGLPKIKGDVSVYATPHQLPTNNRYSTDIESLDVLIAESRQPRNIIKELTDKRDYLIKLKEANLIHETLKHISIEHNIKILEEYLLSLPKDNNNYVLIFDEADKAPPEVIQPLLEILQFKTINGTKINVKACILTSNLPDEHVHSEQISHAITNRCLTVELLPNISKWIPWARENNIHPLIIGFLSRKDNSGFFHKRPKNSDLYAYAYCTPRGWEKTSDLLWNLERYAVDNKQFFQYVLIASAIGDEAAKRFKVWVDCYSKLDPLIDHIFVNGNDSILPSLNLQSLTGIQAVVFEELPFDEQLICAIGICSKYMSYVENENNYDNIKSKTDLIFGWMYNQEEEIQTTAIQSTLKGSILEKKDVARIPSANKLFLDLKNNYDRNKI